MLFSSLGVCISCGHTGCVKGRLQNKVEVWPGRLWPELWSILCLHSGNNKSISYYRTKCFQAYWNHNHYIFVQLLTPYKYGGQIKNVYRLATFLLLKLYVNPNNKLLLFGPFPNKHRHRRRTVVSIIVNGTPTHLLMCPFSQVPNCMVPQHYTVRCGTIFEGSGIFFVRFLCIGQPIEMNGVPYMRSSITPAWCKQSLKTDKLQHIHFNALIHFNTKI